MFYIAVSIAFELCATIFGCKKFDIGDLLLGVFICCLPIIVTVGLSCMLLDRSKDKINKYVTTKLHNLSRTKND